MRTHSQVTNSLVVFCNRVGVDESISFWGGSEVIAPSGRPIFSAPFWDEGLFNVDVDLADIRRERISLPVLRDERPELIARELDRVIAERAGLAAPAASEDGLEPGLDVVPIPAIDGSLR
jgi:predicted amidohydrolase